MLASRTKITAASTSIEELEKRSPDSIAKVSSNIDELRKVLYQALHTRGRSRDLRLTRARANQSQQTVAYLQTKLESDEKRVKELKADVQGQIRHVDVASRDHKAPVALNQRQRVPKQYGTYASQSTELAFAPSSADASA